MATTQFLLETSLRPNSILRFDGGRMMMRFQRELALHKQEEARLRCALARAEALLGARTPPLPTAPAWQGDAANCAASLTPRQREIMKLVLAGHPSKNIAADLGISQRTVENHRAAIMKKTGSKSLPALGRFGYAASMNAPGRTEYSSAANQAAAGA
jgi:DNA-binding NarL/FixJ family response regulator